MEDINEFEIKSIQRGFNIEIIKIEKDPWQPDNWTYMNFKTKDVSIWIGSPVYNVDRERKIKLVIEAIKEEIEYFESQRNESYKREHLNYIIDTIRKKEKVESFNSVKNKMLDYISKAQLEKCMEKYILNYIKANPEVKFKDIYEYCLEN